MKSDMFKTYLPALALLLFAASFTACSTKSQAPKATETASPITDGPSNAEPNWLATVQADMATREYNIQWQEDQCAFSSPNRQNNLRITYREDGFSLEPRVDSLENWRLAYEVQGVFRGREKVVTLSQSPSIDLCGSEMQQHFAKGLHIQYQNTPQGMRQNFLLDAKPAGVGQLKVRLNSKGGLFPVKKGNGDVVLAEKNPMTGTLTTRVWYKDLVVLDANGESVPASMQVTEPKMEEGEWLAAIDLVVDDAHATYPLVIDPISTTAAAMVEGNLNNANLGYCVAGAGDVNGDGFGDVAVGAIQYDYGVAGGAVFVYHGSATGISTTPAALLVVNQFAAAFGCAVGTAGDVNGDGYSDVIAGAYNYDNGQTDEGAAFVFHGSATGINPTPTTMLECNQASATMGFSTASAGDVNGDGYSDVIVGARDYTNGQSLEGAAFVYHGGPAGISTTASVTLESNQVNALAGFSTNSAGDVNGDGYSDVIVGAYGWANSQTLEGAAFVYHGSATGINPTAAAILESNQVGAQQGSSVSGAGDVNGDGYSDIAVGARLYDNGQTNEGAVFIYHGSAVGINPTFAAILECNQADARIGTSVSSAGDVNGDGYADVIAGAFLYDNGETDEGAAFVFQGSASGVSPVSTGMVESNQANSRMGQAVASAGDVNGDGYSDVVVGAWLYSNGQGSEGVAFVYHGAPVGVGTTAAASMEGNQNTAYLGGALASAGDVNGDGYGDVIVGAFEYDNGQLDEGAAFIYHGAATGLSTIAAAMLQSNVAGAQMGYSVAGAGDVNGDGYSDVIVSAHTYGNGQIDEGAAYLFHGSGTGINTVPTIVLESNQANAWFGFSVASAGDLNGDGYADIVVGAYQYDLGETDEGVAFTYHGSSTGIGAVPAATLQYNQANAHFGCAVASAGDINGDQYSDMIIGADQYDNGQADEGAAFVYHGSSTGVGVLANSSLEVNQISSMFGHAVSSAGDANGDGYGDVIVGAYAYDNGENNEGAGFVFHGGVSGLNSVPVSVLESNQAFAQFGVSVSGAGDVNGDGYSDMLIGANGYDNGEADEGAAFIYQGSSTGVSTTSAATLEANQASAQYGYSVAYGGDVNGDGYSDILAGAFLYDNGQSNEGAAFIYYGNGGTGLSTKVQQFRPGSSTPVGPGGMTGTNGQVRYSMTAKSFLGRQKGKLVWETKANGIPFSSAGGRVTNSVASSGQSAAFTNLTGTGTVINEDLTGLSPGTEYKWRSRIRYNPVTAITGQLYGPWYYHKSRSPEVPMLGYKAAAPGALCLEEVNVLGNAVSIADGDLAPTTGDHTDFGSVLTCSGNIVRTFTIQNTGTGSLTISSLAITGANFSDFTVTTAPTTPLGPGASTTFQVTFDPSAAGLRSAVVNFATNDCNEAAYDFAIQGTGNADIVAPAITCPSGMSVSASVGACSAPVSYIAPVGTDNCPSAATSQIAGLPSGATFPVGVTTNTFRVTDGAGNSTTCAFTVTVTDGQVPTINCPANTSVSASVGVCSATVSYVAPVGTDNCSGATTTQTAGLASGASFPVGVTTNTFRVTDGAGNSTTCAFTVTVTDGQSPAITCPANTSVSASVGACSATVSYVAPVGTDNCSGATTTQTAGLASGASFPVGVTTNTFRVTDGAGNSTTCAFTVTVTDAQAPTAVCQSITVQLDPNGNGSTTAAAVNNGSSDNCAISSTSLSQTAFTCANAGANTVTLTVTDASGNTSTCTAIVTVLAQAVTASAQASTSTCGYNITCAGANDGTATATGSGGCPPYSYLWSNGQTSAIATGLGAGTYSVTVTDGAGGTAVQTVTLTAPAALALGAISAATCTGDSTGSIDLSVAGGNDCVGYAFAWSNGAVTEDLSGLAAGNYTVTVTDIAGCAATQNITVAALPLPQPSFAQNGNLLTATQAWSSYQWLLNGGNIPGANGNTYLIAQSGTYSLSVTDTNGCVGVSDTSLVTGMAARLDALDIALYPNPARGEFWLQAGMAIGEAVEVRVTDIYGRRLLATVLPGMDSAVAFDIGGLAAGAYFVEIVVPDLGMRTVLRLVVQ